MMFVKNLYLSTGALFTNREGHSHHKCHILNLFVVTVMVTSFKHIICGSQLYMCL